MLSGSNCRIIHGAIKTAKATINEEKGVFVTAEIIAVTAAAKIPANHTIPKPKKISCRLFKGRLTPIRESPKFACISAFQPRTPYCTPKATQKRMNRQPIIIIVQKIKILLLFNRRNT